MIQYTTGPRPRKKPKPKSFFTPDNEEVFYSHDLDLANYASSDIHLFGWLNDTEGFILLADQIINDNNGQEITITNGIISAISTVVQ
jgi:hypothetical protein